MKKIVLAGFIITGLFTGVILSQIFFSAPSKTVKTVTPVVEINSVISTEPTQPEQKIITQPVQFSIPKIGVNTVVESVAKDAKGNMDVPKKAANVAWYNLGVKPGETGNAVLAGHFDDETGAPAVFYNLNSLEEGDELQVTDEKGTRYIYSVTKKVKYPLDEFPIPTVFGKAAVSQLNLITCEGTFNKSSATYSHRLVVFSELKEVKEI